jgi:hypothetical protein
MRSFINAITVTNNASNRQDCVTVAGMVELRLGGLRRLHLYGGRPVKTAPADLAGGKPGCSPERHPVHGWQERTCSAKPCSHGRSARRCAARIS